MNVKARRIEKRFAGLDLSVYSNDNYYTGPCSGTPEADRAKPLVSGLLCTTPLNKNSKVDYRQIDCKRACFTSVDGGDEAHNYGTTEVDSRSLHGKYGNVKSDVTFKTLPCQKKSVPCGQKRTAILASW